MPARSLTLAGFLTRWAFAVGLVLLTFNPTGVSFVHWALTSQQHVSLKVLATVVLVIVYLFYVRATVAAIGRFGMILVAALVVSLVWVMAHWGLLDLGHGQALAWVMLVMVGTVLGVGLSWAHLRRAITGQVETT